MISATQEISSVMGTATLGGNPDAALYLEAALGKPVRSSIQAVLHQHPQDPIFFLAESLRAQHKHDHRPCGADAQVSLSASAHTAVDAFHSAIDQRITTVETATTQTAIPPLRLSLSDGNVCQVRALTTDFARAKARHGGCTQPPPSSFPLVLYREAASLFEVGSCLRQLHERAPHAPLLLFVEPPHPTSNTFFYEGMPYACTGDSASSQRPSSASAMSNPDVAAKVRASLASYGGAVQDFSDALRAAAADAVPTTRLEFFPSAQTDYLAPFDQMERALDDAEADSSKRAPAVCGQAGTQDSRTPSSLPSVLLVSYRVETARHTHARVLAAYGPRFEAAQRRELLALRKEQLKRRRKFSFAFAMEYWGEVQRRRETSSSNAAAAAKVAAVAATSDASDKEKSPATGDDTGAAAAVVAVKDTKELEKEKRVAARAAKRSLPAYDADQQAEDDVFLVVIRRLEHAAATRIQSVYRGHRARLLRHEKRAALPADEQQPAPPCPVESVARCGTKACVADASPSLLFPLARASLDSLCEEGKAFHHVWTDLPVSPPPDSRRCWIYRPVRRTAKAVPLQETCENTGPTKPIDLATQNEARVTPAPTRSREDWVQEELLIPPLRATQPRARINLTQRLVDYLALAQCTLLRETAQLFADTPGMSVLQRRSYDNVKSLCLTLFFIAYAELRQRDRRAVPETFSQYMREWHDDVLGWFKAPHEASLLLHTTMDSVTHGASAMGRPPAVELVEAQLRAHETFLVAHDAASTADSALTRLSPHIFVAPQPLLPSSQWCKAVAHLATELQSTRGESATGATADVGAASHDGADVPVRDAVHWWSIAAVPMCSVEGVPVAAVRRWDTQQLAGAPAYDCFVPRLRTVAVDVVVGGVVSAAQASSSAAAVDDSAAAEVNWTNAKQRVVSEWLQGDLTTASDQALVQHTRDCLACEGYLECYGVSPQCRGASPLPASFVDIPHHAVLEKSIAVKATAHVTPQDHALTEESVEVESETACSTLADSVVSRRRSMERKGGWQRVMEAVAMEVAASRRGSPRNSSVSLSPCERVGGFSQNRRASPQSSTNDTTPVTPPDLHEEPNMLRDKTATLKLEDVEALISTTAAATLHNHGKQKNQTWAVHCVDEVADVVAAHTPMITLHHTRRALRFVPGLCGAKQLDVFVEQVVNALGNTADGTACLVLALDAASQAFFALAAVLVDHRLRSTRSSFATAASKAQHAGTTIDVATDEHLTFLCGYHTLLDTALADTSAVGEPLTGTPKKQCNRNESVQAAITHVAHVLSAASAVAPPLHLLSRLKDALQHAEASSTTAASEMQYYTTLAVQLAEQYAWLVLLEWYLWSPHFKLSLPNSTLSGKRRLSKPAAEYCGFAEVVRSTPAAMQWIEQMDPWVIAKERCPDHHHRCFSNGLRRWDDKHYVCFGVL
jgi:hypothetical protein